MKDEIKANTSLAINTTEVQRLIERMNAELENGKKVADELGVDQKTLASMDYDDVKRFEQELSNAYKRTEEARKDFKRNWEAPMKSVEEAFKAETDRIKELHLMYKGERATRDAAVKGERMDILAGYYIDFCEGNGVPVLSDNIPFMRIFDPKWLNGGKNWSEKKQGVAVIEKATKILSDWNALKAAQLHYRDEAEIEFFKTLDFAHVIEHDQQVKQERDQLAAMHQQEQEAQEWREEYETVTVTPDEYEPENVPEPEPVDEPSAVYAFSVEATQSQLGLLLEMFAASGIHGNKTRTRFNTWQECHAEVIKHVR